MKKKIPFDFGEAFHCVPTSIKSLNLWKKQCYIYPHKYVKTMTHWQKDKIGAWAKTQRHCQTSPNLLVKKLIFKKTIAWHNELAKIGSYWTSQKRCCPRTVKNTRTGTAKHRFCISIWNKIFGDILDIYRQEDKETSLFNYKWLACSSMDDIQLCSQQSLQSIHFWMSERICPIFERVSESPIRKRMLPIHSEY